MDTATLQDVRRTMTRNGLGDASSRLVPASEFRQLLVSHRRMVRADRRADRLKGLQDLDTGELFYTDERWLLDQLRG